MESDRALPWKQLAACTGSDPKIFYDADFIPFAKHICRGCEVRAECLELCLSLPENQRVHGVWGGTTEKERRLISRTREATG